MVADTTAVNDSSSETTQDQSATIIVSAMKWAAAASIIPVPYLDLVGLAAVQLNMVKDLAKVYGQPPESEILRGLISTLIGTLAPVSVSGALVGSSLKTIPGAGSVLGSVSVAAFGSAATYAIGKVFVMHFEKGGTVKNFSVESVKEELKRDFAKAKKES
jgi:uncharacterized protein (DUF697 family)